MNEFEFENELKSLAPAPASASLGERIERDLRAGRQGSRAVLRAGVIAPIRPRNFFTRIFPAVAWISTGAVAALLAAAAFRPSQVILTPAQTHTEVVSAAPESPSGALGEIETSRELVNATEEDLLVDSNQEPSRRMRFTFIERHTWTDPQFGGSVRMEIPREDVLLVPVAMQ
jgi:hypothetical protein